MNEIEADYGQVFLLPPVLDDWIGPEDPARFICDFVDSLDLREVGIKVEKNIQGRPGYSDRLLLKIWIYGYFEGIRSCRKLEKACRQQLPLIWLTGLHYPDHNTLWLFSKHNRGVMKKLFKEVVKLCAQAGLVGMVLHAVDGTKIAADVSKKKSFYKSDIELVLEVLEESIGEYFCEVDSKEKEEEWEYKIPGKLKNREERKKWIREKLEKVDKKEQNKLKKGVEKQLEKLKSSETNQLNETDVESRMIKCEGKLEFSYNAQAVVDDVCGIITAENVVNEESDNYQLVPMLDETKENLGKVADETASDGGYFSGNQLFEAELKGYNVLVNILEESLKGNHDRSSEFHQCNFTYDAERDLYICPRGGKLTYYDTRRRKNYEARRYQCKDYESCPVRFQCSKAKEGRRIEVSPYQESIQRQIEKQKDIEKKALLKKGGQIVELVFGNIKRNCGFRRWTVRGLEKVKSQWSMICMSLNLKQLYKLWIKGDFQFAF